MTPPSVRRAGAEDLDALASINAEVHELHFARRPDQFKRADLSAIARRLAELLQDPAAKLWVAELGGVVVGYVVVMVRERPESPYWETRKWWELDNIGVRAEKRRAGVGRALVDRVRTAAIEAGIHELELSSWAFNGNAHAAFAALGFEPKVVRFELRV